MEEIKQIETILESPHHGRKFLIDVRWRESEAQKPLVLFIHGFKGFKDWGPFNAIANQFARAGFVFAKLNLSHNGTTVEQPLDFADLEAFGQNNISIELSDISVAIDWIFHNRKKINSPDLGKICLIGHSRGGGLAILQGNEDNRVNRVATWAAVSDFANSLEAEVVEKWKKEGVRYIWNGRTKQQMPQYFQIYENLISQKERFDIPRAAGQMMKPLLLIHGTADETVSDQAVVDIVKQYPQAKSLLIEGAGHTFEGKHPFTGSELPTNLQKTVDATIQFF